MWNATGGYEVSRTDRYEEAAQSGTRSPAEPPAFKTDYGIPVRLSGLSSHWTGPGTLNPEGRRDECEECCSFFRMQLDVYAISPVSDDTAKRQ